MSVDLNGIITWLKGWFYDKTEVTGFLNNKANQSDLQTLQGTVTSLGETVNGKIDTAGTGLSKSGTTLNHSNSVTAQTSAVFKKIKYDAQGHITGTANVSADDLPVHTHSADKLIDQNSNNYSNIGITTSWAEQGTINTAINTAIGNLSSIRAIEVVSTLPTASSSTIGKLYIISENSKINVYYTEENSGSYSWHKMDSDILDELSIDWSDVQNKPSSFTPSSHANGTTTYGVGTTVYYGHNKVIDALNKSSYVNGESLSAHQGYVLKQAIQAKQNIGDCITSIELVQKTDDETGAIRLYYGDEPTNNS